MMRLPPIRNSGCALLLLGVVFVRAQTWTLDPAVAPALVNDVSLLLNATWVPAPGGQFLLYGDFTHLNSTPVGAVARMGSDGKIDPTFSPDLAADERVLAMAPLADGRVMTVIATAARVVPLTPSLVIPGVGPISIDPGNLAAGGQPPSVTVISGTGTTAPNSTLTKLVRLRADGRKDQTFAAIACDGSPRLTAAPDGRVMVWGSFRTLGGQARTCLARLNLDGTLDAAFAPSLIMATAPVTIDLGPGMILPGAVGAAVISITALAVAPNGAVLLSVFASPPSTAGLISVLPSGAIGLNFRTAAAFQSVALQPDGSFLAGSGNLARYTATGAVDRTYSAQIPGLKNITRIETMPNGRLAVEANVGAPTAFGAPAVFVLDVNGQLERDLRKVFGAREGQRLLAASADGRVLVAQGTLVLNTSYYPLPLDATAPATPGAILPIFSGPILADPALALSAPDASTLTPLTTTLVHRYPAAVSRLDPDSAGRVLASGWFTQVDGQPRPGLARFLASGALDATFAPGAGELIFAPPDRRAFVRRTTIGPIAEDGFHRYASQIVRLQNDGSVDASFTFPATLDANKTNWLAAAPDGRLLIAAFDPDDSKEQNLKLIWLGADGRRLTTLATTFSGFTRYYILTPEATGSALPTEVVATMPIPIGGGIPNVIDAAQLVAGEGLLVAGAFSRVGGAARARLARLQSDGTLDAAYTPDFSSLPYPNGALPLPDGRALGFGSTVASGRWQPRVVRLRADGSLDPAFAPPPDALGSSARLLPDGSFFHGGRHVLADGWPDLNFAPLLRSDTGVGYAGAAVLTPDGRLWLGGGFDRVNGQTRSGLARFVPTEVVGITVPPASQKIVAGRDAFLQVAIGTTQPATYRWTHDGATITGATSANLRLATVRTADAGVYRAFVTLGAQAFTSEPATLTVVPGTSRLVNFSARSIVSPGAPPQIAGLVCTAAPPRMVLLRAVGRGLPAGLGLPTLSVPVLTLYDGARAIAEDRGGALRAPITALARSVGAFPLNPSPDSPGIISGSALATTLGAGAFTAMTSSGDGNAGVSLFEFYDTGSESDPPLVRNLAIRGQTSPGAGLLTGGMVVVGNGPLRLLIRGIGPALGSFGVSGAIADPRLEVFAAGWGEPFATNTGWSGAPEITAAGRTAGAFALTAGSRDAALILTLEPGAYTAQLTSVGGASGSALLEIYVLDP